MSTYHPPATVLDRQGIAGHTTGASHRCHMAGCTGLRVSVRWPDGTHTRPCTKGLKQIDEQTMQIQ